MDRAIIEQNVRSILNTNEIRKEVVETAESLNLQSSTIIALKPNQEPARIHICCVLAVEKLGSQLELPIPDLKRPPIPPSQYRKLLTQFREKLLPELSKQTPVTPTKPSAASRPRASAQANNSPRRTPRSSRQKAVDYLKEELEADGNDSDNTEYQDLMLTDNNNERDFEEPEEEFSTPRKRPPSAPLRGSPSPRKSPRKRVAGPSADKIQRISERMGLAEETTEVIHNAYQQYAELVKDVWGLLYGLFVVISDRAEPRQGSEHERKLALAMGQIVPEVSVDRDEWVNWVEKIVTGQSWIMRISKRPEAQPTLVGAPGGWGLGVEFTLV